MNQEQEGTCGPAMQALEALMERLRAPGGCAWDREQTFFSLLPYTIEEVYEVVEAVESRDHAGLREELGDLLFHVIFYSQIARDENLFTLSDVARQVTEKMVRRHPHVFGDVVASSPDQVIHNWEQIKKAEKAGVDALNGPTSIFDGVSGKLPALLWAYKIQQKMHKAGFDWNDPRDVVEKVREELTELDEARQNKDADAIEEELGDVLFTMVNLSRHLKVNPETALRRATLKFQTRFRYIERQLHQNGERVDGCALERLEALWQESKGQVASFQPNHAQDGQGSAKKE